MRQISVFQDPTAALLAPPKRRHGKFDYPATLRASTAHFHVYYDPALGQPGIALADGVLGACENDYSKISSIFGGLSAGPFNVILALNPGGAYHYGCGATDLYCDVHVSPLNPALAVPRC